MESRVLLDEKELAWMESLEIVLKLMTSKSSNPHLHSYEDERYDGYPVASPMRDCRVFEEFKWRLSLDFLRQILAKSC